MDSFIYEEMTSSVAIYQQFYFLDPQHKQNLMAYTYSMNEMRKLVSLSETGVYLPRIVFLNDNTNERVFALGGYTSNDMKEQVHSNYEVVSKNGKYKIETRQSMQVSRCSFGCAVDEKQAKVYVIGGAQGPKK